jgi:NTP pyrophosphatase (non-canonical NTP hydrolase)
MQIAEFQQWVKDTDRETQWEILTALQLVSHLTEEVGELAHSINRVYRRAGDKEKHLLNLRSELVDVFWFLVKIANKFDVDLETEVQSLVRRADEWPIEEYRGELVSSLSALDEELSVAKSKLNLEDDRAIAFARQIPALYSEITPETGIVRPSLRPELRPRGSRRGLAIPFEQR